MYAAFPRADYYGSSALVVVLLRPLRLAQFLAERTIRVPVFRSSTFVSLGGELYPWRCGRWVEEKMPHLECATRTRQWGDSSPTASDRLTSAAITACGGRLP